MESPQFSKGLKVEICERPGSGRYTPGSIRKVNRDGTCNVEIDGARTCRFNVPLHLLRSPLSARARNGSTGPPNSVDRDLFQRQLETPPATRNDSPAPSDDSSGHHSSRMRSRYSMDMLNVVSPPGSNNKVPLSTSSSLSTIGANTPSPTEGMTTLSDIDTDRIQRLSHVALGSNSVGLIVRRLGLEEQEELGLQDFQNFFRKGLKLMNSQVSSMQLEALFLRMDSTDSKSVPCEMVAEFITPWYQLEKQLRGGTADHHELGVLRMQIFNAAFSLGGNRWSDLLLRHDKRGCGHIAAKDFHSLVRRTLKLKAQDMTDRQIASIFRALGPSCMEIEGSDSLGSSILLSDLEDFIRSPYSKFRPFVSPSTQKIIDGGAQQGSVCEEEPITVLCPAPAAPEAAVPLDTQYSIVDHPHWKGAKSRRISEEEMSIIHHKCFAAATSYEGRDYVQLFEHLDKNHNGELEPNEFHSLFRRVLKLPPNVVSDEDIAIVFNGLDHNGSGTVYLSNLIEFSNKGSAWKSYPDRQEKKTVLEHVDQQPYWNSARNQNVAKTELESIRKKCFGLAHVNGGRDFSILFEHLDKDHDGMLKPDELYSLFRHVLQVTRETVPDEHIAVIFHKLDRVGAGAVSLESLVSFANEGIEWHGHEENRTATSLPAPEESTLPRTSSEDDKSAAVLASEVDAPVQTLDQRFNEAAKIISVPLAEYTLTPHEESTGNRRGLSLSRRRSSATDWRVWSDERLKQRKSPSLATEEEREDNPSDKTLEEVKQGIRGVAFELRQQLSSTSRRTRSLQKNFGASLGSVLKRADIPSDAGVWAERVSNMSVGKAADYVEQDNTLFMGLLAKLEELEEQVITWKSQHEEGEETSSTAFKQLIGDLESVENDLNKTTSELRESTELAKCTSSLEEQLSVTREALKEAEAAKVEAEKEAAERSLRAETELRNAKAGTGLVLIGACIGAGLLLRSRIRKT